MSIEERKHKPKGDAVGRMMSEAIYEAMCAYTKEHKRIRARGPDRVNARCLSVAVDAYNKRIELGPEEEPELIEDDSMAAMSDEEERG